jgi:hypothetical protein
MLNSHVFTLERPSKRPMPWITASQVSCTTSSATARLGTYWHASRTSDPWYRSSKNPNASPSRAASAFASTASSV